LFGFSEKDNGFTWKLFTSYHHPDCVYTEKAIVYEETCSLCFVYIVFVQTKLRYSSTQDFDKIQLLTKVR